MQTAYTIANLQRMDLKDAEEILEIDSVAEKLKKLISLLVREAEVLQLGQKIQNEARGEIEKVQREYFLREQMKAIQKELGEKDEQSAEAEEFRRKIDEAKMSEEADKQARRELDRLSRLANRRGRIWRYPYLPGLVGLITVVKGDGGQKKWDFHQPVVRTKHLSREQLGELAAWANQEFYTKKNRIDRVLSSTVLHPFSKAIFQSYMAGMSEYVQKATGKKVA